MKTIIYIRSDYLNPTAACQTKAKSKNKIGITGRISTNGLKIVNTSGNFAIKVSIILLKKFLKLRQHEYNQLIKIFS